MTASLDALFVVPLAAGGLTGLCCVALLLGKTRLKRTLPSRLLQDCQTLRLRQCQSTGKKNGARCVAQWRSGGLAVLWHATCAL